MVFATQLGIFGTLAVGIVGTLHLAGVVPASTHSMWWPLVHDLAFAEPLTLSAILIASLWVHWARQAHQFLSFSCALRASAVAFLAELYSPLAFSWAFWAEAAAALPSL
jgi:hypothetical protein